MSAIISSVSRCSFVLRVRFEVVPVGTDFEVDREDAGFFFDDIGGLHVFAHYFDYGINRGSITLNHKRVVNLVNKFCILLLPLAKVPVYPDSSAINNVCGGRLHGKVETFAFDFFRRPEEYSYTAKRIS